MTDLWQHLKETDKPIALYGTGNGADKIIARMEQDGSFDKVKGIFASSGFVRDRYFHEIKVESYEAVKERLGDMIVLLCFGSSLPEVMEYAGRIASENEFYAPAVPVYGDEIFDMAYYEKHLDKIEEACSLMADNLSVTTFRNTVSYFLTGDIKYLQECETTEDEEFDLTPADNIKSYLDLGAYNGDTALQYSHIFPAISNITAVEPDIKNYAKLVSNTEDLGNVKCFNYLISDESGITHINLGKGRGVHEQKSGKEIESITVDDLLAGSPVDLIKYDVEGNEFKALTGSANTIREYKPLLHIACYHKSSDIYEIPLLVKSLRKDYRIYMRHRRHLINWDTQFVCV